MSRINWKPLLIGCAFFDSLGIGFETQSYQSVEDYIKFHPDWYKSFVTPWENPYYDIKKFEPGIFTDDFQLTFAMVKSLIESDGISLYTIAQQHINEYLISTNGWGNGTKASVERLMDGISPLESGNKESVGNGVLMKITPIAYYLFSLGKESLSQADMIMINQITSMTHDNFLSRILTLIHVDLLIFLFNLGEQPKIQQFFEHFKLKATKLKQFVPSNEIESVLEQTLTKLKKFLKSNDFSDQAFLILSNNASFHQIDTFNLVWTIILTKGITIESPLKAISLGGDTDTTGSILGGIVGAIQGDHFVSELKKLNPLLIKILKRLNEIKSFGSN